MSMRNETVARPTSANATRLAFQYRSCRAARGEGASGYLRPAETASLSHAESSVPEGHKAEEEEVMHMVRHELQVLFDHALFASSDT